ncbi:hypothetical protein HPB50_026029 [Hyalomma asiaticum]|uniref:Uncharacterized protein n=1 Tax=Hyalomma asiaticum TaxID=266040 RepID=A0ACB7TP02_HYAAI|nr:hypothetical protein HPB50_026029 [Hyalomma asiaticum]
MSTAVVPKRSRRRKRKPKPKPKLCDNPDSTSSASSDLPSSMEVIFPRILEFFTMHRKVHEEGNEASVSGGDSKQVAASQLPSNADFLNAPQTARSENWKPTLTSLSLKHSSRTDCKVSSSEPANRKPSCSGDDVFVHDKVPSTSLTESEALAIVSHLRGVLKKKGPSQEHELLGTLSTSQAQIIVKAYGTISAFLDWRPGFEVIRGSLQTFIYYKNTDDEDILDGGIAMPFTHRSSDSGRPHYVAGSGGPRRKGIISSGNPSHSIGVEGRGETQKCRMKDGGTQVPWLPLHHSRALQPAQETRDAEVRTGRCYKDHFPEVKSKQQKQNRDLKITEIKDSPSVMRNSRGRGREAQQLRQNIERPKRSPPQATSQARPQARNAPKQAPLQNVVEVKKNCSSKDAQKRIQASGARAKSSFQQPWPRPPHRPKSPPRGPKANEKPRGPKSWHVSMLGGEAPPPQLRENRKPRVLPLKPMSPSPLFKEDEKPRVVPLKYMPRPTFLPRQRSPSPRPKHEGKPRARTAPMFHPALPQRHRVPSSLPKAEGKPRPLPVEPVYKPLSTKRPGAPPTPRSMAGENPHALFKAPTSRPTPLVDRKLMSVKQSPVPVCQQVSGHKKQVAATPCDAESTPSSKVEPPAKSKAEQYMSRLVQMVKRKKPEYAEQEIRLRLDNLRRSQGGFSHMTLNAIVSLMLDQLEAEEKQ